MAVKARGERGPYGRTGKRGRSSQSSQNLTREKKKHPSRRPRKTTIRGYFALGLWQEGGGWGGGGIADELIFKNRRRMGPRREGGRGDLQVTIPEKRHEKKEKEKECSAEESCARKTLWVARRVSAD